MASHSTCCKNRKAPKTVAAFAALLYPSNPGHDDNKNRVHNPVKIPVKYERPNHKVYRKGWWFRLDPGKPSPFLLDGSGDGKARGAVRACQGIKPHPSRPDDRLVCFNACNLKMLKPPGQNTPVLHGFTWNVKYRDPANPNKNGPTAPGAASGWISLDALQWGDATRKKVVGTLKSWACCMRRYKKWGKALTAGKSTRYRFCSVDDLKTRLKGLAKNSSKTFDQYFKEKKKGSVKTLLKQINGDPDKLRQTIGILSACKNGNKLTDYLPKGEDFKTNEGYTNLCANLSVGKDRPLMAPIALDIFPAGHAFHRLKFKNNQRVYGFIYRVPKTKNPGKQIGRVVWYFGYCDVVSGDPDKTERRYGWVPALALKKV